ARAAHVVAVARGAVAHDALAVGLLDLPGLERLDHPLLGRHAPDPAVTLDAHETPCRDGTRWDAMGRAIVMLRPAAAGSGGRGGDRGGVLFPRSGPPALTRAPAIHGRLVARHPGPHLASRHGRCRMDSKGPELELLPQ